MEILQANICRETKNSPDVILDHSNKYGDAMTSNKYKCAIIF